MAHDAFGGANGFNAHTREQMIQQVVILHVVESLSMEGRSLLLAFLNWEVD
jgi:hypothetical protein